MENDLDAYSRVAVPLILARFPEWEPWAEFLPQPDRDENAVYFSIPCPSPSADRGLWLSTADEELAIGFHTHQNHFTNYESPLDQEHIEAGIRFVADILEERVGVVTWYQNGRHAGSRSVELPHPGPLPGMLDAFEGMPELAGIFVECDRVTLRSWTGQFDRTESRAAP